MTDQDKAVALAIKHGILLAEEYRTGGCVLGNFTDEALTAMLTEQDQQSRADERQRLVDASGVMPAFRLTWHNDGARYTVSKPNIGDTDCYDSEAIASMQAKVEQSEQRVRELEKDAARYVFVMQSEDFALCKWGEGRNEEGVMELGWNVAIESEIDAAMKKENG